MRKTILARVAPLAVLVVVATPGAAQQVVANGVNAAGESATERSALFTSSAYQAPKGRYGMAMTALVDRASAESDGLEASVAMNTALLSGYFGVTNRITLGAFVPFARMSAEATGLEDVSLSGMADAGLFTRVAAFQSATGSTRFAFTGGLTLPTASGDFRDDDGSATYNVGGALSQRAGRWTLHASPSMHFVKDYDAGIELNVAGVFAATPKLNLGLESLNRFGGALKGVVGAEGDRDLDLAAGLRYRLSPHVALDAGMGYNVSTKLDPAPTRVGALFGMHWAF